MFDIGWPEMAVVAVIPDRVIGDLVDRRVAPTQLVSVALGLIAVLDILGGLEGAIFQPFAELADVYLCDFRHGRVPDAIESWSRVNH